MYCPECGTELEDGAEFCTECGNNIGGEPSTVQQGGAAPIEETGKNQTADFRLRESKLCDRFF